MTIVYQDIEHGGPIYRAAVFLRDRVLRAPLGLCFSDAELERERTATHIVAMDGPDVVGTVMLVWPMGAAGGGSSFSESRAVVMLRQMAVDPVSRSRGVGRGLIAAAKEAARRRGVFTIHLKARLSAVGFYEKNGFSKRGDVFEDVTIPHVLMVQDGDPR